MEKLKSMPTEELQALLSGLELMDSFQASEYLGLKPATLRNPKNRYKNLGVKIGQYWFWRKGDIIKMMSFQTAIKIIVSREEGQLFEIDVPKFSVPSPVSGMRQSSSGKIVMSERDIAIMVVATATGVDEDWIAGGDFDGTETAEV